MALSYLDKFRKALPSTQGRQILRLLVDKKNSGEIRNLDEFKSHLKSLTERLLTEKIKPGLKIYKAITGEDISSEQFNDMLQKIEYDLEAIFTEANNIDELVDAHHQLIEHVSLKTIRLAINRLESQINLYEFIERNGFGFDDSQFNTFRESGELTTSRNSSIASSAFVDVRASTLLESDCTVDSIGEQLTLGLDQASYVNIRQASVITGSYSTRSEIDAQFANSDINHIIDGKNYTYWGIPILTSKAQIDGVYLEVQLDLNGAQDINFVEVEPAAPFPMILVQVDYLDSNNDRIVASNLNLALNGPKKINLNKITAKSVILRLKQDNNKEIQFKPQLGSSTFYQALTNKSSVPEINLDDIAQDLRDTMTSSFLLEEIYSVPTNVNPLEKYYQYSFGIDNVRVGYNKYEDTSIFVSQKKTVVDPGLFAIKVSEIRPYQVAGTTDVSLETFTYPEQSTTEDLKYYHGIIEYWLLMQFYDDKGSLISTDYIPVLPLGAERVYHEQLIFSKKTSSSYLNKNACSLMFYTLANTSDVMIYRNGTLLVHGVDWSFSVDVDLTVTDPNSSVKMKRGIEMAYDVNPLDIYTVSYTPKISNTYIEPSSTNLLSVVDLTGDQCVRIVGDNVITIGPTRMGRPISSVDCYLMILMRRNSANLHLTPAVAEYLLVTGSKDQDKFTKDF